METLVLVSIFIVLLSIFVPYLQSRVEASRRIVCANNLRQIRNALQAYAKANNGSFPQVRTDPDNLDGYTAFSGPDAADPFSPDSAVRPNDATASLWLLARDGLVSDLRVFVCPSAGGLADRFTDGSKLAVSARARGNFRSPQALSYSYASPFSGASGYHLSDTLSPGFALLADLNPGVVVAVNAPPRELAKGNSENHGKVGQNVVYVQGEITFVTTPYCGRRVTPDAPADNIYTARAPVPTTQAAELPADVPGVVGPRFSPVSNDDSYLVPTAQDAVPRPTTRSVSPAAASKPATRP